MLGVSCSARGGTAREGSRRGRALQVAWFPQRGSNNHLGSTVPRPAAPRPSHRARGEGVEGWRRDRFHGAAGALARDRRLGKSRPGAGGKLGRETLAEGSRHVRLAPCV